MRKSIVFIIIMTCLLVGCHSTKQDKGEVKEEGDRKVEVEEQIQTSLPEWTEKHKVYKETYEAIQDIGSRAGGRGKLLEYDEIAEYPRFNFSMDDAVLDQVFEAITPVWKDKDIPMFGFINVGSGGGESLFQHLSQLECTSLRLELDTNNPGGKSIADIRNLVEYKHSVPLSSISNTFPTVLSLKELTLSTRYSSIVPDIATAFPKLEVLTILISEEHPFKGAEELETIETLHHVNLLGEDYKVLKPSIDVINTYNAIKKIPSLEKINGVAKDEVEIPMDEKLQAELDKTAAVAKVNEYGTNKVKELRDNQVNATNGELFVGEKIIVYFDNKSSVENGIDETDYRGFPQERLAKNFEEADTFIIIYGYFETVGRYGAVWDANKTYTMVATINLKGDGGYSSYLVGTEDPPREAQTVNGVPIGTSGKLKEQEAFDYVLGLL
ncbi:uncharacterized protein (DUF1330 family) [Aequitasia blattaphilus]|uniref:Lipoprotein n=1 Tax=Aequitasia blattaphilus TaxID=2949332 RepID=A0ABT1E562_9FIRM|nr:hypothetical protein [Aequitasia blattaphilus]MCP1100977.1 hypothetical protein [Aequitasia blattaphilus]MCR8613617.1 hypothetical protein [Aequitasia blattaphilus]